MLPHTTTLGRTLTLTLLCTALALAGCGGGGGGGSSSQSTSSNTAGVNSPSLQLSVTSQSGVSTNSLKISEEATISLKAVDSSGNPLSNKIVEIANSDSSLGGTVQNFV